MVQQLRQQKLLQALDRARQMSVADVMQQLNVSRDTARRDIVAITEKGLAQRIHGGVQVLNFGSKIPSFQDRLQQFTATKIGLAKTVLPLITAGQYVFIDVSTTLLKLTQLLTQQVTVYTHSLDNAISLATNPAITLHVLGGELNQMNRFMAGPETLAALRHVQFDQVIVGAVTVTATGIYFSDEADAAVKRQALAQTAQGVLVCEHRKFGQVARFQGGTLAQLQVVVTDEPLRPTERAWFKPTTTFMTLTGGLQDD
ncbi:DeoR/GlpR family DNA-binding transcription regulator [Lactiplantibacillus sp. WILCCON 0030]|uniref:DeoR/GlpR family DNA-binding transcription regulator n=1 Tax=Lactiplantibacillus brownii TaxID=3069269 RepID=A0ABU1AC68_9LACO|nr:DeoR/GlpR family DNA-binding transcription regulator [Lactiplantibacillus brownii]MDQ7938446.1 DeoR/GlpR family DNA-binding transcription regulator [Lactiplantibacillus brownii]